MNGQEIIPLPPHETPQGGGAENESAEVSTNFRIQDRVIGGDGSWMWMGGEKATLQWTNDDRIRLVYIDGSVAFDVNVSDITRARVEQKAAIVFKIGDKKFRAVFPTVANFNRMRNLERIGEDDTYDSVATRRERAVLLNSPANKWIKLLRQNKVRVWDYSFVPWTFWGTILAAFIMIIVVLGVILVYDLIFRTLGIF